MADNIILYDWVSFTSKIDSSETIKDLLGLSDVPWQLVKGAHGYRDRWYFESISIHFNGTPEMGVWCEMSGQGCRAFETHGHGEYDAIFSYLIENPDDTNMTRLDVAYDDFQGLLDLTAIAKDTLDHNFVSRFRSWKVEYSDSGTSVYHGSPSSEIRVRIYDKKAERNRTDLDHWVRCEIQMRRDRAFQFIQSDLPLLRRYFAVLNNYLRYIQVDSDDSNIWRASTADHWARFLQTTDSMSIFKKPGVEYNIFRLENFVVRQAGGAIDTYIKLLGIDELMLRLLQRRAEVRLNPKYEELLRERG